MIENYNNVRAVLNELRQALKQLRETGATYSIYIEKTGLAEEEQVEVLETLGRGHITITFNETDQPVECMNLNFLAFGLVPIKMVVMTQSYIR